MSTYADFVSDGRANPARLVDVHADGARATVTMNDPSRLNALSTAMMVQLNDALTTLSADPAIRSIVLTGTDPAFSAGGDLAMIADGSRAIRDAEAPADTSDAWRWIRHQFGGVVRTIASADAMVIAAVNGPAAGVGLAFALACDLLVASERAVLVPAFGRLGLVPEVGTSWLMTRRLGVHGAMALYVEGRHLDAHEALRRGLVQEVHPHDELERAVAVWCERAEALPKHAFAMTKTVLRECADATWPQSLAVEEMAEANAFSTASLSEAADALRGRG